MSESTPIPMALRILGIAWIWGSLFALRWLLGDPGPAFALVGAVCGTLGTHRLLDFGRGRTRIRTNEAPAAFGRHRHPVVTFSPRVPAGTPVRLSSPGALRRA